jgi:DNA-binding beta-propeller fold protein YncE
MLGGAFAAASARAASPPLGEVAVIPLPGVVKRIDHFALDPAGQRLFVNALGNGSLEVLDLTAGKRLTSIGGLKEPQGVAFLPDFRRIVVAMRGGAIASFDDRTYQRVATLPNMGDADNLRYDAAAKELYVGYGEGALGVIDPAKFELVRSIPVGAHPESFRLEEHGPLIFVNVPPKRVILVLNRRNKSIVKQIPLGNLRDNYPMSLDESGRRLFVAVRNPAELLVFDTSSGARIAAEPCVGDSDDLFYDARRARVYVIGGAGFVDVFDATATGKYQRMQRISTRAGARTGLWSSELDRLFVAWPNRNATAAEIHVLAPA